MDSKNTIQTIASKNIDEKKWNECVNGANRGLIYAKYDYLQNITDNWAGIVVNDYEAVMPVPYRQKMGIRYCYTVPFIQQLGLFGIYTETLLQQVIEHATQFCKYGDLHFNSSNDVSSFLPQEGMANNFILHLQNSYPNIKANYTKHLQTKLKQASRASLSVVFHNDISEPVSLFQKLYGNRLSHISTENYNRLQRVATLYTKQEKCFAARVTNGKNEVLATALFLKDQHHIYNILPSTTSEGRKQNAMHFLLDFVIKRYAESDCIFDFEGSDVPGIKAFYQSFGAVNQPYYHYHFNKLPFPLRLFGK